ncbi:hypothetical protein NESM_000061000 [Novymonas esmeraldas]|uniref:RanBP2-type domain-containing protein n=1 Tax=Novymonas esmeraldas TaxID=1808958 RepID=A0AAW0F0J6_9TRYP
MWAALYGMRLRAAARTATIHSARRAQHTSVPLCNASNKKRVTRLPRGMSAFHSPTAAATPPVAHDTQVGAVGAVEDKSSHTHRTIARGATSSSTSPARQLPPWPADALEYNAAAARGGHDARVAWRDDGAGAAAYEDGAIVAAALSFKVVQQLSAAEETAEAQAALRSGGWVCAQCWSVVPATKDGAELAAGTTAAAVATDAPAARLSPFPRTVCPTCHTLRHDAEAWEYIAALRRRPDLMRCEDCGEMNACVSSSPAASSVCRCCGSACTAAKGGARRYRVMMPRLTVAIETDSRPIGHVVVTRNRTTRWRCAACKEINSLQMSVCRNCARGRYDITVDCPACDRPRVLSNALVFGSDAEGAAEQATPAEVSDTFHPRHCHSPSSPRLVCLHCHGPLHGGRVTPASWPMWWCACGVVNSMASYSCQRCRLPREVEDLDVLRRLLRVAPDDDAAASWDFASCTKWLCESCYGVNTASHRVVAAADADAAPSHEEVAGDGAPGPGGRRLAYRRGVATCRHCGAAWHHQLLHDGRAWRCACHALNTASDAACVSCGLPALDGLRVDMLSSWSRGDWRCPTCGGHCYRDRQQCSCGAQRGAAGRGVASV